MHKKYRYRKRFLSFLAASLLVPVLVMSVPMSDVKADRTTFNTIWQTIFSGDRDEIEAADSFYDLASVAGNAFSTAAGETGVNEVIFDDFANFPVGRAATRAGGLLGYCDEQHAKNGFSLGSLSSYSSAEWSYNMLFNKDAEWNENGMVFAPYVSLGAVFSDLGIDKTGSDFDSKALRRITGGILFIAYVVSMIVPFVFRIVVQFLKWLNPFQFFWLAGGNLQSSYAALKGDGSDMFPGLSEFIRQWFTILQNMGGFVITFFTVILIFTILMSRRARYDIAPYKKWLIRAAFIVFGIPLLGSTYTAMLNWIDDELLSDNMSGAKVIASTLCDFESFVNNGMKYSGDLRISVDKNGSIRASGDMSPQDVCLDINHASGYFGDSFALYTNSTSSSNAEGAVTDMVNSLQNTSDGVSSDRDAASHVYDMINRYISGDQISSSDYANRKVADMWLSDGNENRMAAVQWFLMHYNSVSSLEDETMSILRAAGRPSSLDWDGMVNPFVLSARPDNFRNSTVGNVSVPSSWASAGGDTEYVINYSNWDPSVMSVYNYLRSDFSSNKLTVYSAKNSSSDAVIKNHYSVNLVGKGIQPVMIVLTSVVMLLSFSVIGIYYSLGIVMTNLRRGIQLILSVPLAMLGSLKAIARIVTYTIVMFLEILGSIIAYAIITELMYSIITSFISALTTARVGAITLSSLLGTSGFAVLHIAVIIFVIWFMVMAVKLRKNIVRGLDQQAEAIISKFITGSAMHTGALNSKELTPVRQLGERPERTMGQKIGAATVKVASAAVNGAVAAAMLSSGNVPGAVSQMVSGAKNLQGAKQEASGETDADNPEGLNEVQADDDKPAYQGRIESKLKGLPGPTGEGKDGPKDDNGGDGGSGGGGGKNRDIPSDPNISNNGGVSSMINANKSASSNQSRTGSGTRPQAAPSGGGTDTSSVRDAVEASLAGVQGGSHTSQISVSLLGTQSAMVGSPQPNIPGSISGPGGTPAEQPAGPSIQQSQFNMFGSQPSAGGGTSETKDITIPVENGGTEGQASNSTVRINHQGQPSGQPAQASDIVIDLPDESFKEMPVERKKPKFGKIK